MNGRRGRSVEPAAHSQQRVLAILRLSPGLSSSEYARLLGAQVDLVSSTLCALRRSRRVYSVVVEHPDGGEGWPEWWPETY